MNRSRYDPPNKPLTMQLYWRDVAFERLRWAHGDRVAVRISLGLHEPTNRDIEAWRNFGRQD